MENNIEFNTPEELAEFVLTECGDMTYYAGNFDHFSITIENNFDMEKIYYLNILLKEKFNTYISHLYLNELEISKIEDGYLENMNLETLMIFDNEITKIPKLPDTLTDFHCDAIGPKVNIFYSDGSDDIGEGYFVGFQMFEGDIFPIFIDEEEYTHDDPLPFGDVCFNNEKQIKKALLPFKDIFSEKKYKSLYREFLNDMIKKI